MYAAIARKFIKKIIKLRRSLISGGNSRRNLIIVNEHMEKLENYLREYNYTDKQMAAFIMRHQLEIIDIIPGSGSGNHSVLMTEFTQLRVQALDILTPLPHSHKLKINSVTS